MKNCKYLVIFFSLISFVSCNDQDSEEVINSKDLTAVNKTQDIYTCGYGFNGIKTVAKFWKNGAETLLTNGVYNAQAVSIDVIDSDVYVAGFETDKSGIEVAKYWKNGIEVLLGDATKSNSNATSITVVDNNVYVAGFDFTNADNKSGSSTAKYWKNGVAISLSKNISAAKSIAVVGPDVYIAGSLNEILSSTSSSTITKAVVWKESKGVITVNYLPYFPKKTPDFFVNQKRDSEANDIIVIGSDIYVAGRIFESTQKSPTTVSTKWNAKLWKNDLLIDLTDGTLYSSDALGVTVAGSDVYVAGFEINTSIISNPLLIGKIWKNNGKAITLTNITKSGKILATKVVNGDWFAVGNEESSKVFVSTVWRNETPSIVIENAVFTDLFVTDLK